MAIFTILIMPIHEHGRSFLLLRSSAVSFFRDFMFLSYRPFLSLLRITPRYSIPFVTTVKCSFPCFLSYPIVIGKKEATYLFELILYSTTLLKLFISCGRLWQNFCNLLYIASYIKWYLDFFLSKLYPCCNSPNSFYNIKFCRTVAEKCHLAFVEFAQHRSRNFSFGNLFSFLISFIPGSQDHVDSRE